MNKVAERTQLSYAVGGNQQSRAIKRRKSRAKLMGIPRHFILIVFSIAFLLPLYWMVTSALKSDNQIFAQPIVWWPPQPRWDNFIKALNYPGFPFLLMLWNSIFYSGTVVIGTVISSALVGYGFARLPFPGRNILFTLTLATLMIPGIVTFIPTYVLFKSLGMIGSYAPLIAPNFLGNAFYIFMMRQFFLGLSWELSEAAKIDGAGEFRIFWQIMLPLVVPALIVIAIFTLLSTWQDFFGPLIYLSDPQQYPLSLGLFAFKGQRTTEWALLMAGSTLVTLPLIGVFMFTQRYFVQGVAMTGLKG
ncbi:MAG: carbohydrate ABC transporter permease [Ktedonobacteraceae bacterium]|nr:carbohydrate ABC transporter permease [Ktedonobacteraceae bacterium]